MVQYNVSQEGRYMTGNQQLAKQFAEAEEHYFGGRLKEAADLCQAILNADPQYAHAYYLMGALFKATGNFAKAVQFSDLAIKLSPNVASFHLQRGHSLMCMGKSLEAKPSLERSFELEPHVAITTLLLGDIYTKEKRFDEAMTFFKRSLAAAEIPETYEHIGLCQHLQGDLQGAAQSYTELIRRKPDYAQAYINLARVRVDEGDMAEAEKYFAKAAELNPRSDEAMVALAKLAEQRGDLGRASELVMQAVQFKPKNIHYSLFAGSIFMRQTLYPQAEQMFRHSLDLDPNNATAVQGYANTLIQQGKKEEALVHIDKMLELKPDDEVMRYFRSAFRGEKLDTAPPTYIQKLFDEYAERFDSHLQQHLSYNTPDVLAKAIRGVLTGHEMPKGGFSLLDLGCGTGLGAEALKDITGMRVGVDLSSKMIEKAKTKHIYQETAVADIAEYMQQQSRHFDIIIAVDVLVYIGNLTGVFAAARHATKEGGLFAFSVEKGDDAPPFVLRQTARYAHARDYITSLADEYGFAICSLEQTTLRQENNQPMYGYVVVLQKKVTH